jgi:hypothetical protein
MLDVEHRVEDPALFAVLRAERGEEAFAEDRLVRAEERKWVVLVSSAIVGMSTMKSERTR